MSTYAARSRGNTAEGDLSVALAGELLSETGAIEGRKQKGPGAAARAEAQPSGTSSGNSADLIERMAKNTATMAEKELFNQMLHDSEFRREANKRQLEYHATGQTVYSERLRAFFARMLLSQRSRPRRPPSNERDPSRSGGRSGQAGAAKAALSQSEDEAMTEMVDRVIAGTASKAQKRLLTYHLMGSEELFDRSDELQRLFEAEPSKSAQDKAKRLRRILNDCNENLLQMHKEAAAVDETNLAGASLRISPLAGTVAEASPSGGSRLRGNVTGGSGAAGSSQPRRSPPGEGASAIKEPNPFGRAHRADTSLLSRAAFQGPESSSDQVQQKRTFARGAAAAVPELPAGLSNRLDHMRLEQQPQSVQHSERSGSSMGVSGNPKTSKKGKSKKYEY